MCFLVEQMFLLTLNLVQLVQVLLRDGAPRPLPSAELQSAGEKQCTEILAPPALLGSALCHAGLLMLGKVFILSLAWQITVGIY